MGAACLVSGATIHMDIRLKLATFAFRGAPRRIAVCFALSLAVGALMDRPSWAEGNSDANCPAMASAMKGQQALRTMAEDTNFADGVQILAIGSSSTEGVGASSSAYAYPSQLDAALEKVFPSANIEVQNAGVGGETAEATIARLEDALQHPRKPDLVIWQVGTNDAVKGGNEDQFQALLERGIAAVQRRNVDLILLDQQFYPMIPDLARYERYVQMVGTVAAKSNVGLFSRYEMMKEWAASSPAMLAAMLSKDRFHMGDHGYRCLAGALAQEIASAFGPPLTQSMFMARGKRVAPSGGTIAKRT